MPEEVHDVSAVEALPLHDKRLLPEKLLDWSDLDRHPEHFGLERVSEPLVVHAADAIARREDQVHMVARLMRLREPVRERDLRAVAGIAKRGERAIQVAASHKEIEVLGVAHDAGVLEIRVGSPHQKWNVRVTQHVQRAAIERVGVATGVVERRLKGHPLRLLGVRGVVLWNAREGLGKG
jgi:hypothetical protein